MKEKQHAEESHKPWRGGEGCKKSGPPGKGQPLSCGQDLAQLSPRWPLCSG